MKLYTIRKQCGQWAVFSHEAIVLRFETYDEAIEIARGAAEVLLRNRERRDDEASERAS